MICTAWCNNVFIDCPNFFVLNIFAGFHGNRWWHFIRATLYVHMLFFWNFLLSDLFLSFWKCWCSVLYNIILSLTETRPSYKIITTRKSRPRQYKLENNDETTTLEQERTAKITKAPTNKSIVDDLQLKIGTLYAIFLRESLFVKYSPLPLFHRIIQRHDKPQDPLISCETFSQTSHFSLTFIVSTIIVKNYWLIISMPQQG